MYDYVIVGAGSAGCVLADRPRDDADVRVLLVEAEPPGHGRLHPHPRGLQRPVPDPARLGSHDRLGAGRDFNDGEQDGFGWYQVTRRDGRRASTAVSYLHPAIGRPNLTIETYAQVLKLTFDRTRATGVVAQRAAERHPTAGVTYFCQDEVPLKDALTLELHMRSTYQPASMVEPRPRLAGGAETFGEQLILRLGYGGNTA